MVAGNERGKDFGTHSSFLKSEISLNELPPSATPPLPTSSSSSTSAVPYLVSIERSWILAADREKEKERRE